MSTFYLLPPRILAGHQLLALLGLAGNQPDRLLELCEAVARAVENGETFVIYREDLPAGEDPAQALVDGFGAEPGDEVIEIRLGEPSRCWRVGPLAIAA